MSRIVTLNKPQSQIDAEVDEVFDAVVESHDGEKDIIEIAYIDAKLMECGMPLSHCEEHAFFSTPNKAIVEARKLIRAGKVWMDCVELHVSKRGSLSKSVSIDSTQDYDIYLNHIERWSVHRNGLLKQSPHMEAIRA